MEIPRHLIDLLVAIASDRNRLAIENAVLRRRDLSPDGLLMISVGGWCPRSSPATGA